MARNPLGGFAEPEYPPVASKDPVTGEVRFTNRGNYVRPLGSRDRTAGPASSPIQRPKPLLSGAAGGAAGISASSQVIPTTDSLEALVQTGTAGISGAFSGAVAGAAMGAGGGPVGAVVGGIVGLAAGGLNAWLGVRASRRASREAQRREQDILERQERRERQARLDALEQRGYDRRTAAIQSQWAAQELAKNKLYELFELDENAKNHFLNQGL